MKDLLTHVLDHEFLPEGQEDSDPYVSYHEAGVKRILAARSAVVEYESKEVIRTCIRKS